MDIELQLPVWLPTQKAFAQLAADGHPEAPGRSMVCGYFGGWGSGKTTLGKWLVFDALSCYPGLKALVVRDTFTALNITAKKEFLDRMVEGDPAERNMAEVMKARWNEKEQTYTHLSGASVIFGGLDKVEKWGSAEFALIWVDEASLCQSGDLEFLLSRLRQKSPRCPACRGARCPACGETGQLWGASFRRLMLVTSNHVYSEHFLYKLFVDPGDGKPVSRNFAYVEGSSWENDAKAGGYLPEGYLESLVEGVDERMRSVYVDGHWGTIPKGTPVYRFLPTIQGIAWHKRATKYVADLPLYVSFDFGWRYPFATVHQLPRGTWRVLGEFTMPQVRTRDFAEALLAWIEERFPQAKIPCLYGDPAGWAERSEGPCDAETVQKVFGVPFRSVASTEKSKLGRMKRIRDWMAKTIGEEPAFAIDQRLCPRLSEALHGMYRYEEPKTSFERENYREVPIEEHPFCDVCHSIEYFAANHFRREQERTPIVPPPVGDYRFRLPM
jgi:hypothetical protein